MARFNVRRPPVIDLVDLSLTESELLLEALIHEQERLTSALRHQQTPVSPELQLLDRVRSAVVAARREALSTANGGALG